MFLDYFALGILFFVVIVIFYGIIVIHDIPDETRYFAGAFWQNSLLRLKEGDEAEVIIDAMPGKCLKGGLPQCCRPWLRGKCSLAVIYSLQVVCFSEAAPWY